MILKSDAKFKEKLTCGFKHDMKDLVNFHPTTQKSASLSFCFSIFDVNLIIVKFIIYAILACNFYIDNCIVFQLSFRNKMLFIIHSFFSKVYEIWVKKIQRSCLSWHRTVMQKLNKPWPCGFKNGMTNWVNFH